MTIHCMLDLETLSTKSNGVILSIGAVKFDASLPSGAMPMIDEFHVGIDLRSYEGCISGPTGQFDLSVDTIMWWLDPERDAARAAWAALEKVDLATALAGFADWYQGEPEVHDGGVTYPEKPVSIWSNAATFDIAMLKRTYELCGMDCPWKFWQENCYRTLKNRIPFALRPPADMAHDALSDARWQAQALRAILAGMPVVDPAEVLAQCNGIASQAPHEHGGPDGYTADAVYP